MTGEERGKARSGSCDAVEGGYTIFLGEERLRAFMDSGDFSSASELGHFKDVSAQIEKRIRERGGAAFLALSAGEKRISRDFAVLQIAHILAQHGKSVHIVDCDFLHAGLSGLVENLEEQGFLDLLLYGSSLKTVARPTGIESVSITGAGSFPVSRTIPFALKEFEKIREFLRAKHDVVIYCSTLYTEDSKINPIAALVDGIVLCCSIEDMPEGELQKNLKALSAEHVPPVELVCFCAKREQREAPAKIVEKKATAAKREEPKIAPAMETPPQRGEPIALPMIERMDDIEPLGALEQEKKPRVNIPRVAAIAVAALIVAFVVWWVAINRSVHEKELRGTATEDVAGNARTGAGGNEAPAVASPESLSSASDTATPQGGQADRAGRPPATAAQTPPAERRTDDSLKARGSSGPAVYTIHVASFKEMSRAEVEKAYLEKNGFAARIVEVDIKGEKWLRILVGEYATMDEAAQQRLALLGLSKIGYAQVRTIAAATR
jgi:cell division protein FtsN